MKQKQIVIYLRSIKNGLMLSCLIATGSLWLIHLWFNEQGIATLRSVRSELSQEQLRVKRWQSKIANLQAQVTEWETNPLMAEKLAREELQLIFPDEEVYRIPPPNYPHIR